MIEDEQTLSLTVNITWYVATDLTQIKIPKNPILSISTVGVFFKHLLHVCMHILYSIALQNWLIISNEQKTRFLDKNI